MDPGLMRSTTTTTTKSNSNMMMYIIIGIIVLALIAIGFWWYKKNKTVDNPDDGKEDPTRSRTFAHRTNASNSNVKTTVATIGSEIVSGIDGVTDKLTDVKKRLSNLNEVEEVEFVEESDTESTN